MDEKIEKLNLICFWLIKECLETNADEMKIEQKNVIRNAENIGDWEIIVKKKENV